MKHPSHSCCILAALLPSQAPEGQQARLQQELLRQQMNRLALRPSHLKGSGGGGFHSPSIARLSQHAAQQPSAPPRSSSAASSAARSDGSDPVLATGEADPTTAIELLASATVRGPWPARDTMPAAWLWRERPCVIYVIRRMGCPLCRKFAAALVSMRRQFETAGAQLVLVASQARRGSNRRNGCNGCSRAARPRRLARVSSRLVLTRVMMSRSPA